MTTRTQALELAEQEKALGNIQDYYVDVISGCVIATCDQGSYVWWDEDIDDENL